MIRALVIDDDAISRSCLRHLLNAHGGVDVVGEAGSALEARALLGRVTCDLVLLDISLGDGSGFDLMPAVPDGTRVIFVTGNPDLALRAFEVNALDYLVKPVNAARLAGALARHETRDPAGPAPTGDVVHLPERGGARITRFAEICVIEAEENYSRVHMCDGAVVLIRRALKTWEDQLPAAQFLRVHRTCIVNLGQIKSYSRDASGAVTLTVPPLTAPLPVGRTFWTALKARLSPTVRSTIPFPHARDPGQPWSESGSA